MTLKMLAFIGAIAIAPALLAWQPATAGERSAGIVLAQQQPNQNKQAADKKKAEQKAKQRQIGGAGRRQQPAATKAKANPAVNQGGNNRRRQKSIARPERQLRSAPAAVRKTRRQPPQQRRATQQQTIKRDRRPNVRTDVRKQAQQSQQQTIQRLKKQPPPQQPAAQKRQQDKGEPRRGRRDSGQPAVRRRIPQPAMKKQVAPRRTPPAAKQPALTQQPAIKRRVAPRQPPPAAKQPALTQQPAIKRRAAPRRTPPAAKQPALTQQPTIKRRVAPRQPPPAAKQPALTQQPTIKRQVAPRQPPPAAKQPALTQQPARTNRRGSDRAIRRERQAPAAAVSQPTRLKQLRSLRKETREGSRTVIREQNRTIIRQNGRALIRHDDSNRLRQGARSVRDERRNGQRVTVIVRPDGTRITTVWGANGHILRRSRRAPGGRDVMLYDNRARGRHRDFDFIVRMAPPRVHIPRNRYIVEYGRADPYLLYETLIAGPLVPIVRPYTLDEVLYSYGLRARMRSIDLNTVTFASGSWAVSPYAVRRLAPIADAMWRAIRRNPDEVFLIEGHTDAVGSYIDNLSLSDRRAEAVADVLTEVYGIPPENMITQGYGEEHLRVPTPGPDRRNRRVTIRRITPLLRGRG
jgi:outer membrane protein OmpA-like peptidoglycan-associated protein